MLLRIVLIRKILFYEEFDLGHVVERHGKWFDNLLLSHVGDLAHLHKTYVYVPPSNV